MTEIASLNGRTILDSRGIPTVEAEMTLASGACGRASVSSGAAPGQIEAVELRDEGEAWLGRGVCRCVDTIRGELADLLVGRDAADQRALDDLLIEADGTKERRRLGANALLAVSLAAAKAAAADAHEPLWRHIGGEDARTLPVPLMNLMHGGPTAPSAPGPLDFQEFMIVPHGVETFARAVQAGAEIYHCLKRELSERGLSTATGDEGGFCPGLTRTEDALEALVEAITTAGYKPGHDVSMALDVGASALWKSDTGPYQLKHEGRSLSRGELIDYLSTLAERYPLISIEDGMDEEDLPGWHDLTARLGSTVQIVGDDVFATSIERLQDGVRAGAANAILIKPNQTGTLTETLDVMAVARAAGYACIVSHRSGDTDDQTIADLALATGCGQIKTGAPARGERTARYNHLMRIEEGLGTQAQYAGRGAFVR